MLDNVEQAILGGAVMVQFRNKRHDLFACRRQADALRELCSNYHVPLIINDDAVLARAVDADGVHLGSDDFTPSEARSLLGEEAVIGVSCYNRLDLAQQAQQQGADYVAFGSFYPSPIKPTAVRAETSILTQAKAELKVPVVAIGGITPENGKALVEAGADMLAVIYGIFGQSDIQAVARQYTQIFEESLIDS
jgi:thiamine-phosphate pyrophosphorylase